jgi:hypothetical protein
MAWMATTPECANQSFNIVNSDYFRWCNLWPRLAEFFGVPMGIVRPQMLAATMSTAEALWASLCDRHKLIHRKLKSLANWGLGDFILSADWDDMSSTVKARRYGFRDDTETETSILRAPAELRLCHVISPKIAYR